RERRGRRGPQEPRGQDAGLRWSGAEAARVHTRAKAGDRADAQRAASQRSLQHLKQSMTQKHTNARTIVAAALAAMLGSASAAPPPPAASAPAPPAQKR